LRHRTLGRTGLSVSALSLGTAALGVEYGIAAAGSSSPPPEAAAEALIRAAVDRGITLIDTAPAYGTSERIVGRAAGRDARVIIATKVTPHDLDASLDRSRRALDRDVLDIVQIHNATADLIASGITDRLLAARSRGVIRVLGASVYGVEAALAVVRSGVYDVLQVAFNVLDQRMAREVLPAADAAGVGVIARSAVLKGVLTPKAQWLPPALTPLADAAARARDGIADGSWERLPQAALRFCLSEPAVASVLIGARTLDELDAAIEAESAGPLDAAALANAGSLSIDDERLLNPSHWPIP
jgi:aryl-alcohol dehydrogenase-like predicted oxidoreductase